MGSVYGKGEGASIVSLLLRMGQPWSSSITITWEFITGTELSAPLGPTVTRHLHLTRAPRSLCAHSETRASATSLGVWFLAVDLSQDKVPFKGEKWVPQRTTCGGNISGSCPGLPSRLPASCLQGKSGQIQALLKPKAFSISLAGPLWGPEPCHHKCP